MKKNRCVRRILACFVSTFWLFPAHADTLTVPIAFDQSYLQQLIEQTIFTGANQSVSVWGDDGGCNDLTLSAPNISIESERLRIQSDMALRTGTPVGDSCLFPFEWRGKVSTLQHARVANSRGRIEFKTVDSNLLGADGSSTVASQVWDSTKEYVHPHLDALAIDLSKPVNELQNLLPLFLAPDNIAQTQSLINSFRLGELAIEQHALLAKLSFDIPTNAIAEPVAIKPAKKLSEQELEAFNDVRQRWDTFLSFVIKTAARNTLKPESRDRLLAVLVDSRYELVAALNHHEPQLVDPVRVMFVNAWRELSPVLRDVSSEIAASKHNEGALQFLSFIAAADALQAIDNLGPVTGWDISVDGLRRLARLLIDDPNIDPLQGIPDVDVEMRELFDFGPPPDVPVDLPPDLPPKVDATESSFLSWFIQDAQANYANPKMVARLNKMAPSKSNVHTYLPLVKELLHDTVSGTLLAKPLDAEYHKLYRPLVLATAWQETCWRQFKEKNKKLVPMKSSAGALGMMQIMPVVWKGFYKRSALANNISYNAIAGAEILRHYLIKYAIRKGEHEQKGGADNLVYASYAAYNGGPRHLSRYRLSKTSESLKGIDRAFKEKFLQVRDGYELAVATCF